MININFLKPYSFSESYPKDLPHTSYEMLERINEITAIVGIDKTKGIYFCTWSDVNPTLTCEVPENILN